VIAEYTDVKSRLTADPAVKVYDAVRQDANGKLLRETYLLLFPGAGDADDDRLSAAQSPDSDVEFEWRIRAVSINTDGIMLLLAKVRNQLSGYVVTAAGRLCSPIRIEDDSDVEPDYSVTPPLLYCDVYITFRSNRA